MIASSAFVTRPCGRLVKADGQVHSLVLLAIPREGKSQQSMKILVVTEPVNVQTRNKGMESIDTYSVEVGISLQL